MKLFGDKSVLISLFFQKRSKNYKASLQKLIILESSAVKRTKNVALALALTLCIQLIPTFAFAAPVVHSVATFEEFNVAVTEINARGGEHVISLQADITDTDRHASFETFNKGETTIVGNGHTLAVDDRSQSHIVNVANSATVNLGDKNDSSNTLMLTQVDTGSGVAAVGAAISAAYGAVVNMYEGVTVEDYDTSGFTYGGAVSLTTATFNMYGGIIQNCKILQSGGYAGAAISAQSTSTINISGNAKIMNNNSIDRGGAIYADSSTVTISGNTQISGNYATSYGGGIYAQRSTVTIEDNAQLTGNKTNSYGGGIMALSSTTITMRDNAQISGSDAAAYGGGMYTQDATVILEDSVQITGNNATQLAGGLLLNRTTATVDDTVKIKSNTAGSAGQNVLYYSYNNLFTLNTTENLDPAREQLIDIRYASSSGQLDFAVSGVGESTVTTNEDINKYFSYEVPTLIFDIESVANHMILIEKPKITPEITYPPEDYVGTAVRDIVKALDPDTGLEIPGIFTFFDINTGLEITNPTLQEDPYQANRNTFGYTFVPDDASKYASVGISPRTTLTITALVAQKLPTPTVSVDYINENLTGFVPDQKYTINGTEFIADATGAIPVDPSYFGTDLTIVAVGDGVKTLDSDPQMLSVPSRPEVPEITVGEDGNITTSTSDVEYSLDGGLTWKSVVDNTISGLAQGQEVLVRVQATGSHFKSEITTVVVSITYTVTFDSNGGTAVSAQKVPYGESATKPSDPTRSGYVFKDWYLNGAPYDFSQVLTTNITLVAQWAETTAPPVDEEEKNGTTTIPKTGDTNNIGIFIAIALVCLGIGGFALYKKRQ